jgi:hypothetical protein
VPWTEKEVLTYDVPVLDTEKAGLGIKKVAAIVKVGLLDAISLFYLNY